MTSRLEKILKITNTQLDKMPDANERRWAYIHTHGVTQLCTMLALKRGLNPELAAVCGLLHDIYAYTTGVRKFHSHSGADQARVILRKTELFKKDEQLTILSAIFHHADKQNMHNRYAELLKDADVVQCFLYDITREDDNFWRSRMTSVCSELNIPFTPKEAYEEHRGAKKKQVSKRELLAKTAQNLAAKGIVGEKSNKTYMNIIRYWPEDEAFDELLNGWCAAFVYHVCMEAGFELPIRYPGVSCRFAGVKGFYEWANLPETGFYIQSADTVTPQAGDIIIYRNIIPPKNKQQNGLERDHIGIIVSCENGTLQVAEGNINNMNKSGIVERVPNENIDGYIRIPEDYTYEGWKRDYKSSMEQFI